MAPGDLNSGFHGCAASTLPTELAPSPLPQMAVFVFFFSNSLYHPTPSSPHKLLHFPARTEASDMSAPSSSYLSAWLTVLPLLCALPCAPTPGPPVFGGKSPTYVFVLPGLAPFLAPVIPLLSFPVSVVSQFGLEYSNTSCRFGTFSLQLQSSLSLPVMRIFKYNNNSSSKEFPKFFCPACC